MSKIEDIRNEMKDAMRAKNEVRLRTLRNIITECTNALVADGKKPNDPVDDETVTKVITRLAKQRKDSIEQYTSGNRPELAAEEQKELEILEGYLPEMMSQEDIKPVAEAKKKEMGIDDKAKMGQLMGAVMKDLKGKADGNDVKQVVESLF